MNPLFQPDKLYTVAQAADALLVSRVTLGRAIERGELEAFRVGSQWRMFGRDLNTYLEVSTSRKTNHVNSDSRA